MSAPSLRHLNVCAFLPFGATWRTKFDRGFGLVVSLILLGENLELERDGIRRVIPGPGQLHDFLPQNQSFDSHIHQYIPALCRDVMRLIHLQIYIQQTVFTSSQFGVQLRFRHHWLPAIVVPCLHE